MSDHRLPRLGARRTIGVLVSVAAIALVLFIYWPSEEGASPEAARTLHRAADAARSNGGLGAAPPGGYAYSRKQVSETSVYVVGSENENFSFITSSLIETWIAPDGSGRTVTDPIGVGFPNPEDESAWEAQGSPDLDGSSSMDDHGPGELGVNLTDIPTEPRALLEAIERREIIAGAGTDLVTFEIIGELLHLSYESPELRAALFEVVADFEGVDFEGDVTDPTGRPGVSVSLDGDGLRHELIFDDRTGELLAEKRTVLDPDEAGVDVPRDAQPGTQVPAAGPPETVVLWHIYLETAIVDSIDERPGDDTRR